VCGGGGGGVEVGVGVAASEQSERAVATQSHQVHVRLAGPWACVSLKSQARKKVACDLSETHAHGPAKCYIFWALPRKYS